MKPDSKRQAGEHVVASAVAIFRSGQVLAMRRAPWKVGAGLWETVSGRVDEGEDPLDTARREVREETGLAVDVDPRPITSYAAMRGDAPMIVVVYRATWTGGEVMRSKEHDDHRWVSPEDFRQLSSLTRLADAIDAARPTDDG